MSVDTLGLDGPIRCWDWVSYIFCVCPDCTGPHLSRAHSAALQNVQSYLSVLQLSDAAKKNRQALETLLVQHGLPRDDSRAAFMHALLGVPDVSPGAAYAVALKFHSLQSALEAVER